MTRAGLTPQRLQRIERLKVLLSGSSELFSAGETASRLGCSLNMLRDDVRFLKKNGQLSRDFTFMSQGDAEVLKGRRLRKTALLKAWAQEGSLESIADILESDPSTIKGDVKYWRGIEDVQFAQAEKRRAVMKPSTTVDLQRRQSQRRAEIRKLEAESGRSLDDLNALNATVFLKDEILGVLSGGRLGVADLRYLRKLGLITVSKDRKGGLKLSLTSTCKSILWDFGIRNPKPVNLSTVNPPDAQTPEE